MSSTYLLLSSSDVKLCGYGIASNGNRTFHDIIADNQFASLGLVLLGCLARVYRIIGGAGDATTSSSLGGEVSQTAAAGAADTAFQLERGEKVEELLPEKSFSSDARGVRRDGKKKDEVDLGEAVPRSAISTAGDDEGVDQPASDLEKIIRKSTAIASTISRKRKRRRMEMENESTANREGKMPSSCWRKQAMQYFPEPLLTAEPRRTFNSK